MPVIQTNGIPCCQPLKPVSAQPIREAISFKNSAPSQAPSLDRLDKTQLLEAKYDFACRLAAYNSSVANYYKAEYNKLCNSGACLA